MDKGHITLNFYFLYIFSQQKIILCITDSRFTSDEPKSLIANGYHLCIFILGKFIRVQIYVECIFRSSSDESNQGYLTSIFMFYIFSLQKTVRVSPKIYLRKIQIMITQRQILLFMYFQSVESYIHAHSVDCSSIPSRMDQCYLTSNVIFVYFSVYGELFMYSFFTNLLEMDQDHQTSNFTICVFLICSIISSEISSCRFQVELL